MHIMYLRCTVLIFLTIKVCDGEVLLVYSMAGRQMLASVSEQDIPFGYLSQTFSLAAAT